MYEVDDGFSGISLYFLGDVFISAEADLFGRMSDVVLPCAESAHVVPEVLLSPQSDGILPGTRVTRNIRIETAVTDQFTNFVPEPVMTTSAPSRARARAV